MFLWFIYRFVWTGKKKPEDISLGNPLEDKNFEVDDLVFNKEDISFISSVIRLNTKTSVTCSVENFITNYEIIKFISQDPVIENDQDSIYTPFRSVIALDKKSKMICYVKLVVNYPKKRKLSEGFLDNIVKNKKSQFAGFSVSFCSNKRKSLLNHFNKQVSYTLSLLVYCNKQVNHILLLNFF